MKIYILLHETPNGIISLDAFKDFNNAQKKMKDAVDELVYEQFDDESGEQYDYVTAFDLNCSPSAISKWERGIDTIPNKIIDLIKEKFGADVTKSFSNFDVYKQRIKDLESENKSLVNAAMEQDKKIESLLGIISTLRANLEMNIEYIKESIK